ncbi:hypothetical protein [Saccharothrix sp. HUAS TT1]|uniref:hypothetical protein n=1 Tax=unclassified Saccharothrix TaxID=2593673 RepID=UPI00345C5436
MSTDTSTEITTDQFAAFAATGFAGAPPVDVDDPATAAAKAAEKTARTAPITPAAAEAVAASATDNPATTAAKAQGRKARLSDANRWIPRDYAALNPAVLREVRGQHPARCQALNHPLKRGGYRVYGVVGLLVGTGLQGVSWSAARISARLIDPRHPDDAPPPLADKLDLAKQRATNASSVFGKVGHSVVHAVVVPVTVGLDLVSWLAAQTAVTVNDPARIGRAVLGLVLVAVLVTVVTTGVGRVVLLLGGGA